jgi:hypothetical protein
MRVDRLPPSLVVYGVEPLVAAAVATRFAKEHPNAVPGWTNGVLYRDVSSGSLRLVAVFRDNRGSIVVGEPADVV